MERCSFLLFSEKGDGASEKVFSLSGKNSVLREIALNPSEKVVSAAAAEAQRGCQVRERVAQSAQMPRTT